MNPACSTPATDGCSREAGCPRLALGTQTQRPGGQFLQVSNRQPHTGRNARSAASGQIFGVDGQLVTECVDGHLLRFDFRWRAVRGGSGLCTGVGVGVGGQ